MTQPVIAGYARSPFHFAKKGALAQLRPDDMLAMVLRGLVDRLALDPALIEDVLVGCAYPEGEQGNNLARIAALLAGLPYSVTGMTMNRFCGSSMSAIHVAAGNIAMGAGECFIAAGVESMSFIPQGGLSPRPNPRFPRAGNTAADLAIQAYISMGETAENVASRYGIIRQEQDALGYASQVKAAAAQAAGMLEEEIVPVSTADGLVDTDGCLRPQTTMEGLAGLKTAFRPDGTVTAGTASPLTDGASATLVCTEAFARAHGLRVLARIKSIATGGVAPEVMGLGPIPASRKALARAGITMADIGVVELNEAFAAQAIACIRDLEIAPVKLNIDGGAIAIGHPLGATGARITGKAAQLLARTGRRYALATQCIGGGQGIATVLEAA